MNTLVKSGGAWLLSPSLAVVALRKMRVSGLATSSSSSFPKWEGGVSMVQGASRGIGLEFVSLFSLFHLLVATNFLLINHYSESLTLSVEIRKKDRYLVKLFHVFL